MIDITNIFKRKRNSDRNKLISLINSAADGKFEFCDENNFTDKELARSYNNFVENFYRCCNETAMELNKSMQTIGNCGNVQSMLEIVEHQRNSLSDAADVCINISQSIADSEVILNTINKDTAEAYENSILSKDAINETFLNVNQSCSAVEVAADAMKKFSEKSEAITDILKLISDIAEQTQILSLNAKIEASRSSNGKGFGVVADEIGRLSLDTQKTVGRVNQFIIEILDDIQELVSQLDDLKNSLESGKSSTYKTEQFVQKMADNMQNVINEISKLYSHINLQNDSTKTFTENMLTIAGDSETLSTRCREPGKDMYVISRSVDKIRTKYVKGKSCLSNSELLEVYDTDHLIFTGRLYNMIQNFETLELKNISNPKTCKFGKWLEKLKGENPILANSFKTAEKYHNLLHETAVLCFNANKDDEKEKAFEYFEQAQEIYGNFSEEINRLKSIF